MAEELTEELEKLRHENQMLKNRCAVFTEGTMCPFCPYKCSARAKKYRGCDDAKEI